MLGSAPAAEGGAKRLPRVPCAILLGEPMKTILSALTAVAFLATSAPAFADDKAPAAMPADKAPAADKSADKAPAAKKDAKDAGAKKDAKAPAAKNDAKKDVKEPAAK
jgi:hypothetical protein